MTISSATRFHPTEEKSRRRRGQGEHMKEELERLYSHIEDIEIAMMTTRRADGHLQSRAMATRETGRGRGKVKKKGRTKKEEGRMPLAMLRKPFTRSVATVSGERHGLQANPLIPATWTWHGTCGSRTLDESADARIAVDCRLRTAGPRYDDSPSTPSHVGDRLAGRPGWMGVGARAA